MAITTEVIVIGAGVAGLAAARELRAAGIRVQIIEARNRIGGRILTHREPDLPIPIELGAEFIHGSAPEIDEIARAARLTTVEVSDERWEAKGKRLTKRDDFWSRLDSVMGRLPGRGRRDRSFDEFLADKPGGRTLAENRELARQFVQGFHAAEVDRISARALADGGSPGDDVAEQRMGRILDGYDRVPEWLAAGSEDSTTLGTAATRIAWEKGNVQVEARTGPDRRLLALEARAAIITLPLGVLQAPPDEEGAVRIVPEPAALGAASGLAMGSVTRVSLWFDHQVWDAIPKRRLPKDVQPDCMAFLHTRDPDIPVWWTAMPLRMPLLVGWAGGPPGERLSGLAKDELLGRALGALSRQLGISRRRLTSMLGGWWHHDWQRDPWSRGAYSYALVGGSDAAGRLARPVEGTLFFAGEAADAEGRNGTVHGAIASGRRAARLAVRRLGSPPA